MPKPQLPPQAKSHPAPQRILRAFRTGCDPEDRRVVVRHLLACRQCCQIASQKLSCNRLQPQSQPQSPLTTARTLATVPLSIASYDRALRAAHDLKDRLRLERADVPRLWSELQPLSPAGRKLKVENSRRYCTWEFFAFVLEASRVAVLEDARQALTLAELALSIARSLSGTDYGAERVREAEAEALIERANALRVVEKFQAAFRSLKDASLILEEFDGPLDLLTTARHSSIASSLLRNVGDFEGAITEIGRAMRVYVRTGETILYGRALLKQASILRWTDPARGYSTARHGLRYVPRVDHRTRAIGQHTCCDNLTEAGRYLEAWMRYKPALAIVRRMFADDSRLNLSYRWLGARIDKGIAISGESSEDFYACAEATLEEVKEGYARQPDCFQEIALVTLDQVEIFTLTKRFECAIHAAQEAYQLLRAQQLPAFALQSWLALQVALAQHNAGQFMLNKLRQDLARYWLVGTKSVNRNS